MGPVNVTREAGEAEGHEKKKNSVCNNPMRELWSDGREIGRDANFTVKWTED